VADEEFCRGFRRVEAVGAGAEGSGQGGSSGSGVLFTGLLRAVGGRVEVDVARGEFACVVGPSGAGKTTLLRTLAGLAQPTSGAALFEGTPLRSVPPGIGVVFQDYGRSLYPWLTVARNVELPLRVRGLQRTERAQRVAEVLASVGLPDAGRSYPWQLSGGMQQRVAIARSLAYRPDLLLMDEPFASVDAQTRFELEDLILRVRQEFGVTVVFVTHDIDEAVYLADRVIAISKSPGVVTEIVDITLTGARDQITTKADPAFAHYREHLLGLSADGRHPPAPAAG
jgi:NitT/TauT family transport system ATP-binding protein